MSHRVRTSIAMPATAITLVLLAVAAAAGQARSAPPSAKTAPLAKTWTPPKTPWGDPDLQGIYTSDDLSRDPFSNAATGTPLERAPEYGDRLFRTEEELARIEREIERLGELDSQESVTPANSRTSVGPPSHWVERPKRPSRQTSLIVDPPNGRIPALTPEGQRRLKEVQAARQRPPVSWEDFSYWIRCITRGTVGSILPSLYGNGTQIVQTPGYVTILHEMVHEARIVPLDGRPQLGSNIRSYLGSSRGHWEGNTLVVETTNFFDNRTGIGNAGAPTSDALRLVERFTRVDADTLQYEVTVDDPKIYTSPWKISFPIKQEPGYQLYEYTCHETNYAMTNSLSGARAQEKAAEAAKPK